MARIGFEGHYRVSGTSLIKVEDDESITVLGHVPGTDQVSFTYSLNNLAIVADKKLYYYNPTDGFPTDVRHWNIQAFPQTLVVEPC